MGTRRTYNSAAASVAGLASNVTGGTWALSANSAGDSMAHKITVKGDAATNHSAKTAVITGTLYGQNKTETVNLPNGTATVTSVGYYDTVTSVVPSATIGADTMDIGWAADAVGEALVLPQVPAYGIGVEVVSGTPAYSLQLNYGGDTWFNHATIVSKVAAFDGSLLYPVAAMRMIFTAASNVSLAVTF